MKNKTNIFFAFIFIISSQNIAAQTNEAKKETNWIIGGGVFYAYSDSYFDLNENKVDFEEVLNLDENTFSPVFEVQYKFNNRHSINFNFISLRRKGEIGFLTEEVQGPDNGDFLQVGTSVKTKMYTDIFQLTYAYRFFQTEKWNIGLTAGLHTIALSTEIEGEFGVKNEDGSITTGSVTTDSKSFTIPLPNLGLFASYQLDNNWEVNARMQFLYIASNTLEGALFDTRVAVKYNVTDYFSLVGAINYDYVSYKNDIEFGEYQVAYSYIGPLLIAEYNF
jgi:hypothetical protein